MAAVEYVKFSIRLPKELNEKVEEEANKLGVTKNAYITMKLQDKLKK
jgi:predicted HicB family RNase H-like nuclease